MMGSMTMALPVLLLTAMTIATLLKEAEAIKGEELMSPSHMTACYAVSMTAAASVAAEIRDDREIRHALCSNRASRRWRATSWPLIVPRGRSWRHSVRRPSRCNLSSLSLGTKCSSLNDNKSLCKLWDLRRKRPPSFGVAAAAAAAAWRGVPRGGDDAGLDAQMGAVHSGEEASDKTLHPSSLSETETTTMTTAKKAADSKQQRPTPPSHLPLIDTLSVSLALRLTCETNRRLYLGTIASTHNNHDTHNNVDHSIPTQQTTTLTMTSPHEHPHGPNQGNSDEPIPPAISPMSDAERAQEREREEITIFHSLMPFEEGVRQGIYFIDGDEHDENRRGEEDSESSDSRIGDNDNARKTTNYPIRKGVLRWGPELKLYLDTLLAAIGLDEHRDNGGSKPHPSPLQDERQLVLALTMIYLDKASSLETSRPVDPNTGQPLHPPCPYLLPQTVHRLLLAAIVIAAKCVRGDARVSNILRMAANSIMIDGSLQNPSSSPQQQRVGQLDISETCLEHMEQWMLHALGGGHYYDNNSYWQVQLDDTITFLRKWGETFYPQRLQAHDNLRQPSRMGQFWRMDQAVASMFGNYYGHPQYHDASNQANAANMGYHFGDHGHGNIGMHPQTTMTKSMAPSQYDSNVGQSSTDHYHTVGDDVRSHTWDQQQQQQYLHYQEQYYQQPHSTSQVHYTQHDHHDHRQQPEETTYDQQ